MSCFAGKLKEYPYVSVDCFDKNNLDSSIYFLSHCHQDHMNGLNTPTFLNRLTTTSSNTLVYCSETTRNILLCDPKYRQLKDYLVGLPIEHPSNLPVKNDITGESEFLCVTLISAGHCIGSVMFLFEGNDGTVLYTGDFRLSKGDVSRIPVLHCGDSIKHITSVYVDTTFCLPQMMQMPSRERTKDAVLNLIRRWFQQGDNYYVSLLCKGMYGYEYLLKEVATALKMKIHVSEERLSLYNNLQDMTQHFTTDAKETKIHSCNWSRDRHSFSNLPCGLLLPAPQQIKVMKIRPSSMWFARRKEPLPTDCIIKAGENFYRVVHSMHASMEEVIDLIGYLRPLNIFPTVEPAGLLTIKQAQESLEPFTKDSLESLQSNNPGEICSERQLITSDEMSASYKDQKSSHFFSLTQTSAIVPSSEVLAQCHDLGLANDIPTEVSRPRRRRNHTPNTNCDTEKKNEDESVLPSKRKFLPDFESRVTTDKGLNSGSKLDEKLEQRKNDTKRLCEEKLGDDGNMCQKFDECSADKHIDVICTV